MKYREDSVVSTNSATDASLTNGAGAAGTPRIASMDLVRGVVMILMAIDHVRVYSGVPAGGPTWGVFFTRWITNFVAPAFVFIAGTAAYLHGRKLADRAALSKFLLIRGAWLILLELSVLRVCWTFNFDFAHYLLAGVIWMIGWSMILLAAAVYLPTLAVGVIGIAIVALHNLTDLVQSQQAQVSVGDGPSSILKFLYLGGEVKLGGSGPPLMILYVLVPWIGVMMAGYAFGQVMEMSGERRRTICLRLGAVLTVLFIVLRMMDVYGDPRPWSQNHTFLGFLNTTKYPASLEFLLMTLGPMFILWGFAERWKGVVAGIVETFGRVPMFYYLLHIPVIHLAACLVSLIREGKVNAWLFANHPVAAGPAPPGYRWSLGLLYLVCALCVIALYFPSRWFGRLKSKSGSRWLSFF
jgi:uncharacterized membrane protein